MTHTSHEPHNQIKVWLDDHTPIVIAVDGTDLFIKYKGDTLMYDLLEELMAWGLYEEEEE